MEDKSAFEDGHLSERRRASTRRLGATWPLRSLDAAGVQGRGRVDLRIRCKTNQSKAANIHQTEIAPNNFSLDPCLSNNNNNNNNEPTNKHVLLPFFSFPFFQSAPNQTPTHPPNQPKMTLKPTPKKPLSQQTDPPNPKTDKPKTDKPKNPPNPKPTPPKKDSNPKSKTIQPPLFNRPFPPQKKV